MQLKDEDNVYAYKFTLEEVLQLIDKVSESKLDEFHMDTDIFTITMKKNEKTIIKDVTAVKSFVSTADNSASNEKTLDEKKEESSYYVIKSPIVGTFYASKEEGGEPLVKVGTKVKKDSIVAIIEAMKLMNEIMAGAEGEVAEILVENGQLVEYGQEIMKIKL